MTCNLIELGHTLYLGYTTLLRHNLELGHILENLMSVHPLKGKSLKKIITLHIIFVKKL